MSQTNNEPLRKATNYRLKLSRAACGISAYSTNPKYVTLLEGPGKACTKIVAEITINSNGTLTIRGRTCSLYSYFRYICSDPKLADFPMRGPETRDVKLNALGVMNNLLHMEEVKQFLRRSKIPFQQDDVLQMFYFVRQESRKDKLYSIRVMEHGCYMKETRM